MATYFKEKIRNIALIGHSGEGKTSLLEAILYSTKAIDRLGRVDDGTTVSDYDQEEITRHMSISLSMAYTIYKDYKFNFFDVPGFFDFEGELVSALNIVDAAIVVTSAGGQLSVGAEKSIDYCIKHKVPTLVFVNGINRENSDFFKTMEMIKYKYGNKVIPIELPIMDGYKMLGYIDIILEKAYDLEGNSIPVPKNLEEKLSTYKDSLVELAAEANDAFLEKFFGGEPLSKEERIEGGRARIIDGQFIPIVSGIATSNFAITSLLDHIVDLLPTANQVEQKPYTNLDGSRGKTICHRDQKFAGLVFKTIVDPFVGKLLLFKVLRGQIHIGDSVYNPNSNQVEKISSMYILRGKKQDAVDVLYAGDIGALAKLNYTITGDTLCDTTCKIKFDPIEYPEPMMSMAVSSLDKGAEDKVFAGLYKLMEEDSTFKLDKNSETGEMIISGLGESQLEILCKKLKNKFKVTAVLNPPKIAYRETIKKVVEQQGKYKKQSGGHGQYGDAYIRFEPMPGVDFEFAEEIVGGSVPRQYIPAVEKGLRECIQHGVLAGYPVVGLKAVLYMGSYHDVDSSEFAFRLAASAAYKEGLPKANPVLLEPICLCKITVPASYMGDVMSDLHKRRSRILGMESEKEGTTVSTEVPQSEMFKYATDLRSITQGRGSFSLKFDRYEEVPINLATKIIEEYKKSQAN